MQDGDHDVSQVQRYRRDRVWRGARRWFIAQVILPDGSSCIFESKRSGDRMVGGYICLQGGAILERGQWEVERIY
jgi:hypothetical protein